MHSGIPRTRALVCVVTDRRRLCGDVPFGQQREAVIEQARAAAEAGADLLQVRERDLADQVLFDLVCAIVTAVEGAALRVLVNDRPDIALAAGAGVHLRGDGMAVEDVRRLMPAGLVARSVHSAEEAARAAREGADFVVFGTVFPSASKPPEHRIAGLDALADVVRASAAPALAIGGIDATNVRGVAGAGAAGVAAIGWFARRDVRGMRAAVEECRRAFDSARQLI